MENNCPIQVVMNSSNYIKEEERPRTRGNRKDYYAGRDNEFSRHRSQFVRQLDLFADAQRENPYSEIAYAKVVLERKALAKSNRPTEKLITEANECKVVGGSRKGEMLVRFSPSSAQKIKAAADKAEDATTWVTNKFSGKPEAKPSALRSEVGAIREVRSITADERCPFTAEEVVSRFEEQGGGFLYVELFETADECNLLGDEGDEVVKMFDTFESGLRAMPGLRAYHSSLHTAQKSYVVYLTTGNDTVVDLDMNVMSATARDEETVRTDADGYNELLEFLSSHPVVKQVSMSPVVSSMPIPSFKFDKTQKVVISEPDDLEKYPLVGVADTGVADVLEQWVAARVNNINPKYMDENHGTFIGGLYVIGRALNPNIVKERDGNRLVDICVLPAEGEVKKAFPFGFEEFMYNLRYSVKEAVETTGVRVIGLSMNLKAVRGKEDYSPFAQELDDIAVTYNVIFVISAGNLATNRNEWKPGDAEGNVREFTSRSDDIVRAPAESIYNLAIGALNPPDNLGLASYTCKGKGLATATKPDLVQVGGYGCLRPLIGTGLYSTTPDGMIVTDCGTSFAAPLVAKTLAALDYQIEGDTPRETLMALAIHGAQTPEAFLNKKYKEHLRDWLGYGMPTDSESILSGDGHKVTLVFHTAIRKGEVLSFPFGWPQSLVSDGKCRGHVKLTMVCTPQLDYNCGEEFVREELRPSLCQMLPGGGKAGSVLKPIYKESNGKDDESEVGLDEEELRENRYKWNPVKVYEMDFRGLTMKTGMWVLEARYLDRENVKQAKGGLVFTMILTIEDSQGEAPVYHEMRQELQANGVQISDIRTAVRVASRV